VGRMETGRDGVNWIHLAQDRVLWGLLLMW
jgi:hypothetical protein